jgi:hypothetical protein
VIFDESYERFRARLHSRRMAYRACFAVQAPVQRTWRFWRRPRPTDLSPAGEIVMRDLAHYCYARKPTLTVSAVTKQSDALAMAFAEGRRDVFNRICSLMNLTSSDIDRIANHRSGNDE